MDHHLHHSDNNNNYEEWMTCLPEQLWDIPITNLSIPGSHDAMSYCLDIHSPLVRSESLFLRFLDKLCHCLTRPFIFKWSKTQDNSIVEQLSMGIRYFDLRIAQKPHDSTHYLYFAHALYTYLTVLETLTSVASWLDSHPKEIVILACSHFEGLSDQLHQSFIWALKKLFGSKLCPRQDSAVTLRTLWSCGQQVLLSYEDQAAVSHQELWPAIPYWWADQPTAQGVITYLERRKHQGRPEGFFVSGLNLTADSFYIAAHPKQSLSSLTQKNWTCLREWLQEQTPGPHSHCLNIIAGDFVGPTVPFCPLVIALNYNLLRKKPKTT